MSREPGKGSQNGPGKALCYLLACGPSAPSLWPVAGPWLMDGAGMRMDKQSCVSAGPTAPYGLVHFTSTQKKV